VNATVHSVSDGREATPWTEAIQSLRTSLEDDLMPHGILVDGILTRAAPIQVIGRLPNGEGYFFHSRHDTASLDIWDPELEVEGPVPPDPADLIWSGEVVEWSDEESHLAKREISDLIVTLYQRYSSRSRSS
jgi:hypothetical protein